MMTYLCIANSRIEFTFQVIVLQTADFGPNETGRCTSKLNATHDTRAERSYLSRVLLLWLPDVTLLRRRLKRRGHRRATSVRNRPIYKAVPQQAARYSHR